MQVQAFFDKRTSTITYLVYDAATRDAVAIDPVLDYEAASSKTWTESADEVLAFIDAHGLTLHYVLETHAHADHLSGSQHIKQRHPQAKLAIGQGITIVQQTFKQVFGLPEDFPTDGRQFDRLLADGEELVAGSLQVKAIFTPGHTPACVTFQLEDAIFTGDTLFMPDMGTGRCDFPAGSAEDLYDSITQRLYTLDDATRVFVGHDYQPGGRQVAYESTIGQQRRSNVQLRDGIDKQAFVRFRNERDATLAAPKLLFQSVQVNIDAGALPEPEDNEIRYLRIPINVFRPRPEGEIELRKV